MEHGYVLHRRRFRETSLIVELLTHGQGRVAAVARGALRPRSSLGALLQPLTLLGVETRGRSELVTLTRAEALAPAPRIAGVRLYAAFYVNELVMRLTVAHDPVPEVYERYRAVLAELAGDGALEPALRRYERDLLGAIGLGLILDHDVDSGTALEAGRDYVYVADHGPRAAGSEARGVRLDGATLLALAGQGELDERALAEAKRLMRYVLDHHLDGRPLASRELFSAATARKS